MRLFYLVGFVLIAVSAMPVPVSADVKTYVDGSRYVGDVVNGHRQGEGTMYYADGDVLTASYWEWPMDVPTGFMHWVRKNGDVTYLHSKKRWYQVNYGDNKKLWDKRAMMFYRVYKVQNGALLDVIGMVTEKGYGTAVGEDELFLNPGPRSMQTYETACGMHTVWRNPRTHNTEPLILGSNCDAQGLPHGSGFFMSMDGLLRIEVTFEHGKLTGEGEMKLLKVADYDGLQEGKTRLVSLTWAKGTPVLMMDQGQKKIELLKLTVHEEADDAHSWRFYRGDTKDLQPYGKGYCYEDVWRVLKDGRPVHEAADTYAKGQAQACEFGKANGGYASRTDEVFRERIRAGAAAFDARVERDRETMRAWDEESRREAERRAEDESNDAARAARPVPYVPSAVAGAMKLQQIQRDAERYGAGQREARSAQIIQAYTAPERSAVSGGSGPSARPAAALNAATPAQVIAAAPSIPSTSGAKDPASDPNPYQFDMTNWRQVGEAAEPARDTSCSKATAFAKIEMEKNAAGLNTLLTIASTGCVCTYTTISGNYPQWRCMIYAKQNHVRKSGPSDGVSR